MAGTSPGHDAIISEGKTYALIVPLIQAARWFFG